MANLTNDNPRIYIEKTKCVHYPQGATRLYSGQGVTVTSGKAVVLTAGDSFAGFVVNQQDNRDSQNDKILVCVEGILNGISVTGASTTSSVGSAVYMSDGNVFTLTSTGNSTINGKIVAYDNVTGKYVVSFKSSLV